MKSLLVIAVLVVVALLASGCCCCCVPCQGSDWGDWSRWTIGQPPQVGELRDEYKRVPVDLEVSSAAVEIAFGAGEFTLRPGATDLLAGRFVYNVTELGPRLETSTRGSVQVVRLRPQGENIRWGFNETQRVRNEWNIELSRDVPLALELNLGAFQGQVDLGGLRLRELTLNVGACDGEVSFSAPNPETVDDLRVTAGAAHLKLTGLGNARFREMTFRGGAGDFELSFDGAFTGQARVYVESGMSKVVIRVPDKVGTRVDLTGGLASTRLTGFRQSGQVFTNGSYGQAREQLIISVTMGVGELVLESK